MKLSFIYEDNVFIILTYMKKIEFCLEKVYLIYTSKLRWLNQRFRVSLNYKLEGNRVVYEE